MSLLGLRQYTLGPLNGENYQWPMLLIFQLFILCSMEWYCAFDSSLLFDTNPLNNLLCGPHTETHQTLLGKLLTRSCQL